jgi:hypothetical protein
MKRLALTLVIFGALASVSRAQGPPATAQSSGAPTAQAGAASTTPAASCDGCEVGGWKSRLFQHHSWNPFGKGHSWSLFHKDGAHSSLFGGAPKAPAAPPGQPAFPTHPYARGPRDFFMYE